MRKFHIPAMVLLLLTLFLAALLLVREFRSPVREAEKDADTGRESPVTFSSPSGFYDQAFTLTIHAPTDEIYYTLDGTEPVRGQDNTLKYSGGIEISDATSQENVHCLRTDVTHSFNAELLAQYAKDYPSKGYKVPDYPVDKCTIVRAACYSGEDQRSAVATASYFVGYGNRQGYGKMKVVSVVTDPDNLFDYEKGIYVTGKTFDDFAASNPFHNGEIWYRHIWWWWDSNYNQRGREWERPVNVQIFDRDGHSLLQQEAGIRIQGGGSRGFLPKSLNLYARSEYDGNTTFDLDFFGTGFTPKRITLTTGGDDYNTKQKDRLVSELAADQGFATMHYVPCMLFLDGEFWGVYHLTEKYDAKYFSYYYNVPEEDVVEIKSKGIEVGVDRDMNLLNETVDYITQNDMSDPENYERACQMIDIDSFINYYAVLIYCARCGDWPNGNYAVWRTRSATEEVYAQMVESGEQTDGAAADSMPDLNPHKLDITGKPTSDSPYMDGRWRWVLFDVNSSAISSALKENDTLNYVLNKDPSPLFVSLSKNEQFRKVFSQRILEYGRTIFSPESVEKKLEQYEAELSDAMKLNYRRFFGDDAGLDYNEITDTEIRSFFAGRYQVVQKMLEEHFGE